MISAVDEAVLNEVLKSLNAIGESHFLPTRLIACKPSIWNGLAVSAQVAGWLAASDASLR
jgi:hypothetical protein